MNSNDDKCFYHLLEYLFREKIEPNFIRLLQKPSLDIPYETEKQIFPSDIDIQKAITNWKYPIAAMRSMSIINHINYYCDQDHQIYDLFTEEALLNTLNDVIFTVLTARDYAEYTGYLEVVDDNFHQISNGIKVEQLPFHDREILRNLGSKNPEADLCAMVQVLYSKKDELYSELKEMKSAEMLEKTAGKLEYFKDRIKAHFKATLNSSPPTKKDWGLFGIVLKGASLIVPDIASAISQFSGTNNTDMPQIAKTGIESITSVYTGVQTVRDNYNKLKDKQHKKDI